MPRPAWRVHALDVDPTVSRVERHAAGCAAINVGLSKDDAARTPRSAQSEP